MVNARPRQPGESLAVYKSELDRLMHLAFPLLDDKACKDKIVPPVRCRPQSGHAGKMPRARGSRYRQSDGHCAASRTSIWLTWAFFPFLSPNAMHTPSSHGSWFQYWSAQSGFKKAWYAAGVGWDTTIPVWHFARYITLAFPHSFRIFSALA